LSCGINYDDLFCGEYLMETVQGWWKFSGFFCLEIMVFPKVGRFQLILNPQQKIDDLLPLEPATKIFTSNSKYNCTRVGNTAFTCVVGI
jgi:hypothetical protein